MTNQILVKFYNDNIQVFEDDGNHWVALRPICERLGIDWRSQHRKVTAEDSALRYGLMTTPSAGGMQETLCLSLIDFPLWLASISPSKVSPNVREALIRYRNEAKEVLFAHFIGQHRQREKYLTNQAAILAGELIARKPIYAKLLELWRVGERDFNTFHAAFNYSRAKLIDAFHQLVWLKMIDDLPNNTPAPKVQSTIVRDGLQYELFQPVK